MVELGQPLWVLYLCSMSGALMLWVKSSLKHRKVYGFSDLAEQLFPNYPRLQYIFVFVSFVLFGALVGLFVGGPTTIRQAFTAGVAWSRIAAK